MAIELEDVTNPDKKNEIYSNVYYGFTDIEDKHVCLLMHTQGVIHIMSIPDFLQLKDAVDNTAKKIMERTNFN